VFFAAVALLHAYASAQNLPEGDKLLIFWAGTLPIILSAPHGGRERSRVLRRAVVSVWPNSPSSATATPLS
jgi:hypothetical protein